MSHDENCGPNHAAHGTNDHLSSSAKAVEPSVGLAANHTISPVVTPENRNLRMFAFGVVGIIIVALVVAVGVGVYRTYKLASTDRFTVGVARSLRLPLLKVNDDQVLYSEYADDLMAVRTMRDYDQKNKGQFATLTDEKASDLVVASLVNNALTTQTAAKLNVKIEQTDKDEIVKQIMDQYKTTDKANEELQKRYGWTLEVWETKAMPFLILRNKIAAKIENDPAKRLAIRQTAQSVLDQIKNGADFATLAKQYGQDGTASAGGDLGWFGKGDMVPQFENAVFKLKKGELSPELIETQYGYHIVQLLDRKKTMVKDTKGKTASQEQVQARHILFKFPTVNSYFETLLRQANINIYGRIHNPFQDLKPSK